MPHIPHTFPWANDTDLDERKAALRKRDEIVFLVKEELKRYGLMLVNLAEPKYRPKKGIADWQLLGQQTGYMHEFFDENHVPKGFVTRKQLCTDDFVTCCRKAAELLDQLEAS